MSTAPKLTYLDSSALLRRADSMAATTSPRTTKISPHILGILEDPSRKLACSEITLLEFHANLTRNWRSNDLPACDEAWWEKARLDMWSRVESGALEVLPLPGGAFDQVMGMVSLATRNYGRKLMAWDALHLLVASRWAASLDSVVDVVTSDHDFTLVDLIGMNKYVSVVNLDVLAQTGEGADKANAAATSPAADGS